MAKQTFTTGQVLTAAQMTSLQQTAMLGGAASAKTASYTLVAADAGTAISMSNANATTITVNTALFAAGDTVQITNLGSGVCTITAGTATVNTSASLALAQYESGTLDFTSTSAAIFIKGAGAAAGASGANWSLLNTGGTALTGATTITVSGISSKDKIMVMFTGASAVNPEAYVAVRLNGDTGNNYNSLGLLTVFDGSSSIGLDGIDRINNPYIFLSRIAGDGQSAASVAEGFLQINGCASAGLKVYNGVGNGNNGTGRRGFVTGGYYNSASTISSISLFSTSGNFDAGTMYVYTSAS